MSFVPGTFFSETAFLKPVSAKTNIHSTFVVRKTNDARIDHRVTVKMSYRIFVCIRMIAGWNYTVYEKSCPARHSKPRPSLYNCKCIHQEHTRTTIFTFCRQTNGTDLGHKLNIEIAEPLIHL